MDDHTVIKLHRVTSGYRALGRLFEFLYSTAVANKRLNQADLTPVLEQLVSQQTNIEHAERVWWYFYSHVDQNGDRVADTADNEQETAMINSSWKRNHDMIVRVQTELLGLLDKDLKPIDLLDIRARTAAFPDLAAVLTEELSAAGILH